MATYKLGYKKRVYINSSIYGSPSWTRLRRIGDITMNDGMAEADASHRDSDFELSVATLRGIQMDFPIRYNPGEASYDALQTAYGTKGELDIWITDGDPAVSGTKGFRMPVQVFTFNDGAPLRGVRTKDVMMKPTDTGNDPQDWNVA